MRRRLIPAQCPHCLKTGYYPRETCLIKGQPQDFLGRRYFQQRCSFCHEEFEIAHPFYYRDGTGSFAILLSDRDHPQADQRDAISIQVASPAAFYKAFAILHFHLDAALVSGLWKQLEQKQGCRLWLQDADPARHLLWFVREDGEVLGIRYPALSVQKGQKPDLNG